MKILQRRKFLQKAAKENPSSQNPLYEKIMEARRLEAKMLPENIRKWSTNRQ